MSSSHIGPVRCNFIVFGYCIVCKIAGLRSKVLKVKSLIAVLSLETAKFICQLHELTHTLGVVMDDQRLWF